eukprot:2600072-Rhodomonas_salina.1
MHKTSQSTSTHSTHTHTQHTHKASQSTQHEACAAVPRSRDPPPLRYVTPSPPVPRSSRACPNAPLQGLGSRIQGPGSRVSGLGSRV